MCSSQFIDHIINNAPTPQVELVTTRLDFGLLRLGAVKSRKLRLKNASATCGASWVLEEMVTKEGSAPSKLVREGVCFF